MIFVNLHGGLGNQIFQLYKAFYLSKKYRSKIQINTYYLDKYSRSFPYELSFIKLDLPTVSNRSIRFVKALSRLISKDFVGKIGPNIYLDSYYQSFSASQLKSFKEFRELIIHSLGKTIVANGKAVLHVRTTDFYLDIDEYVSRLVLAIRHSRKTSFDVITDDLSSAQKICKQIPGINVASYNSHFDLSSIELLMKFGEYNSIIGNGSTLSFWSAILFKREFHSSNEILSKNYELIKSLNLL